MSVTATRSPRAIADEAALLDAAAQKGRTLDETERLCLAATAGYLVGVSIGKRIGGAR
jgi:hypothetical protein